MHPESPRIGYVLKRYPRYSETFIVNEILAHETAGLDVEIFSLRQPTDTFFPEQVSAVRAPVTYLPSADLGAEDFWSELVWANESLGGLDGILRRARGESSRGKEVMQAIMLANVARSRGITHLHAHFATSAAEVARLAARMAGITYSFTAHAKDIFHESVEPEDLDRKLRSASAVVTVSDFNCNYLRETFGAAADRVHRVYNGLDLERFPFTEPLDRPARVVAVGRLVEKKGFADLIDACAILAKHGRSFSCQMIGGGEEQSALADRIQRLGLTDRVEMLGPQPPSAVIAAIQSAALLAAPCIVGDDGNRDGLPTVLLEAMALGTPCISTNVTGIPEIVRDGDTGMLVPQRDPVALATAIERLLDQPNLRRRLAGNARQLIEDEFDIHENTRSIRELFASAQRTRQVSLEEVC